MSVEERIADVLARHPKSTGWFNPWATRQEVAKEIAAVLVRELADWDGIMALLDIHYPESVFPTTDDREDRDTGPRIISLLRQINQLRRGDT